MHELATVVLLGRVDTTHPIWPASTTLTMMSIVIADSLELAY